MMAWAVRSGVMFGVFSCLLSHVALAENPAGAVPPVDHRWGATEYEEMAEALVAKKVELPTLADARTKKIFERMVSLDNLAPGADTHRPVNQRIQEFLRISRSNAEILKLYGDGLNVGKKYGAEGARELGFALHLSQLLLELMDEFLPTLPRDSNYLSRLMGREQMRLGILQQVAGVLSSLGETELYATPDRSLMLAELAATIPSLKDVCNAEFRDELKRLLFNFRPLFKAPEDLKRIDAIQLELSSPQK